MNKQNSMTLGYATRTLMGISMMALAMASFSACGKKSATDTDPNPVTDGGNVTSTTGTGATTGTTTPTTTGGNTTVGGNDTIGGPGITGNANGVAVNLGYAVLAVNANATEPSKMYALNFLSYNPYCFYAQNPDPTYTTYPNSFDAMSVYLTDAGAAPVAGAYSVGGTMAIDPNSGFEQVTNCVAPGAKLATGSTVTLTAIDTTAKTAAGSVSVTLSDGTMLSGSFTTVSACAAGAPTTPAATPLCTDSTITYK